MYEYNDGLRPGGRRPRLYLAKGGEVQKFTGSNIEGFCAVATSQYSKSGKWSSTTYQLDLAPGVRPLYFLSRLHGTWGDGLGSWGEVAEQLGLPIETAKAIVTAEYSDTASRLNRLEEFAVANEQQGAETEVVVVSFGSPINREIRAGYWGKPKIGQSSDSRTVTIEPGKGEFGPDWYKPNVVEPEGAKIIASRHSPGMHGGYWAIEVAVPIKK